MLGKPLVHVTLPCCCSLAELVVVVAAGALVCVAVAVAAEGSVELVVDTVLECVVFAVAVEDCVTEVGLAPILSIETRHTGASVLLASRFCAALQS